MEGLAEAAGQPNVNSTRPPRRIIQAISGIKPGEFEVRFQVVVGQANVEFVTGKLLAGNFELWAIGERASESGGDVYAW